jgi:hypothetical protein
LKEVRVLVWKRDLEKNKDISHELTLLSRKIEELELAYMFIPKKSYKGLTQLLESRYICYGILS